MAAAGIDAAEGAHGNVAAADAAPDGQAAPPIPVSSVKDTFTELAAALDAVGAGPVAGTGPLSGLAISKPAGDHVIAVGPESTLDSIRSMSARSKRTVLVRLADGSMFDISNVENLLGPPAGQAEAAAVPAAAALAAPASSGESNARLHERKIRGLVPDAARVGPDKAPLLAVASVSAEFAGVPSPLAPFPGSVDVTVPRPADFENPLALATLLAIKASASWSYPMIDRDGLAPFPDTIDKLRSAVIKVKPPLHGTSPDTLAFSATAMCVVLRQVAHHVQSAADFKSGGSFYQISTADVSHWASTLANALSGLAERLAVAHSQSPEDGALVAATRLQAAWLAACDGRVFIPAVSVSAGVASIIRGLRGAEAPATPSASAFDALSLGACPMRASARRLLRIAAPPGSGRRSYQASQGAKSDRAPRGGKSGGKSGRAKPGGGSRRSGHPGRSGGSEAPARADKRPAETPAGDNAKKPKTAQSVASDASE